MATTSRRAQELFVMLPKRLFKAVRIGDLSSDELSVLACLIAAADEDLEVVGTLRGLMDTCGWSKSHDRFRAALISLGSGGWVEFEAPRPGQKTKPWRVRVTGGATMSYAPSYASEGGRMRSSTYVHAPDEAAAEAHGKGDAATRKLRGRAGRPPEEEMRKRDVLGSRGALTAAGRASEDAPGRQAQALVLWIEREAHQYSWESMEEELARRERVDRIQFTAEHRQLLHDAWERLQSEPEPEPTLDEEAA